eukprot:m.150815 g.150815  ORF g.150815 m.150815 type:complete len:79 (+) comp14238_c1_seq1:55-291(+)
MLKERQIHGCGVYRMLEICDAELFVANIGRVSTHTHITTVKLKVAASITLGNNVSCKVGCVWCMGDIVKRTQKTTQPK